MADFYDEVLSHIRYATAEERQAIRAELEGHVEDRAEALEAAGYDRAEAQSRSLAAMGDPAEIGKGLDKQYSRFWLILSRAAAVGVAVLCISLVMAYPLHRLYFLKENLTARWAPMVSSFQTLEEKTGTTGWDPELKVEIGNDILSVYWVALDREKGEAEVYLCNYDQNPFGQASEQLGGYVYISNTAGDWSRSGAGGSTGGAAYRRLSEIPVTPEEDHLTLTYDRFGEHISLEIPLEQEGRE